MSSEFQRVQIDPHYQVYSRVERLRRTPWQQVYADIADLQARVSELEGQTMRPMAKPDFVAALRQEVERQLRPSIVDEAEQLTADLSDATLSELPADLSENHDAYQLTTTSAEPDTTTPDQTPAESLPPEPTDTSPERQATHPLVWQVFV